MQSLRVAAAHDVEKEYKSGRRISQKGDWNDNLTVENIQRYTTTIMVMG